MQANSNNLTAMRTQGSAYAEAEAFCAVGGWTGSGFEPDPSAGCKARLDPYASLALPTVGACTYNNKVVKNTTVTLNPGVYCGGLELQTHGNATLNPGTYIIKDGQLSLSSQSSLSAMGGVTFYLVGSSSISITSGGSFNLKAPVSGSLAGFAIIQNKTSNAGGTNTISSGGDVNIIGIYYTPAQKLTVWANGDMNTNSAFFPMVVDKFEMSGNATFYVKLDWTAAGFVEPTPLKTPRSVLLSQ